MSMSFCWNVYVNCVKITYMYETFHEHFANLTSLVQMDQFEKFFGMERWYPPIPNFPLIVK